MMLQHIDWLTMPTEEEGRFLGTV